MNERTLFPVPVVLITCLAAQAGPGTVLDEQKISATSGGFGGQLNPEDWFGSSTAVLGDLDGDGTIELAVGAHGDDDGGDPLVSGRGAVWILSVSTGAPELSVVGEQKISATSGGFGGTLEFGAGFGFAVAALGDLDDDGMEDLAVTAPFDGGAVWILFMNADGTVESEQKISATAGGFGGELDANDMFGSAAAALGDLDGDGVEDLAVGAHTDDDGASQTGAIWILFLNDDGTVKSEQKISATAGGFGGTLDPNDRFGSAIAALGDLDGDRVNDIAVGARRDDDGGTHDNYDIGAVWILFLNQDGTVADQQKISATSGGFSGTLAFQDYFGFAITAIGDRDGDGVTDLAVGAPRSDNGEENAGAVWILLLNEDGTVANESRISATTGGFAGELHAWDIFGYSVTALGDLDGDGRTDLAAGAAGDDDGGISAGALWLLLLDDILPCPEDIDGSGAVGFSDFTRVLLDWGACAAPPDDCAADFDHDGSVGFSDMTLLLLQWGVCE